MCAHAHGEVLALRINYFNRLGPILLFCGFRADPTRSSLPPDAGTKVRLYPLAAFTWPFRLSLSDKARRRLPNAGHQFSDPLHAGDKRGVVPSDAPSVRRAEVKISSRCPTSTTYRLHAWTIPLP